MSKIISLSLPDTLQFVEDTPRLIARAHRDSDSARNFVTAVAHQNGLLAQRVAYLDGARSEVPEDEIRGTARVRDVELFDAGPQELARRERLSYIVDDVCGVFHRH